MVEANRETPSADHWRQWFETCSALRCSDEAKPLFSTFAIKRYEKNLHLPNDGRQTGVHGEMQAILDPKNSADGVSAAWHDFELMGWRKVKRGRKADELGRSSPEFEMGSTSEEDDALYRRFKEALKEKTARRIKKEGRPWLTALEMEVSLQIQTRTTNLNRWAKREGEKFAIWDDPEQLKPKVRAADTREQESPGLEAISGPLMSPMTMEDTDDFAAALLWTVQKARHGRTLFLAMFNGQKRNSPELRATLGLGTSQVYAYWDELREAILEYFGRAGLSEEEALPVLARAAAMLENDPENPASPGLR